MSILIWQEMEEILQGVLGMLEGALSADAGARDLANHTLDALHPHPCMSTHPHPCHSILIPCVFADFGVALATVLTRTDIDPAYRQISALHFVFT